MAYIDSIYFEIGAAKVQLRMTTRSLAIAEDRATHCVSWNILTAA